MDFQELINNRKSTRYFSDKTIDKDVLETIVEEAQRTPSWVNAQPWKVNISSGDSLKTVKRIYLENNMKGIKGSPDFKNISRTEWPKFSRENMVGATEQFNNTPGFNESQITLFNAPHIVYLTIPVGSPDWSIHDLGMFSQTLMLSAQNQGLDSAIAYALVKYPDVLHENLNIPNDELIGIGIALGYGDDTHPLNQGVRERNALTRVLTMID